MTTIGVAVTDHDADPVSAADSTARLRADLEIVADVRQAPSNSAPPSGAKGGAMEWAQLLVETAGSLAAVVAVIRSWHRREPAVDLEMSIDGDVLRLSGADDDPELHHAMEAWVERHS